MKPLYMPIFKIVDASVLEFREFNRKKKEEEHGKSVKVAIISNTPVSQDFLDF